MSTFHGSVTAGISGLLIVLPGEVDITTAAELGEPVTGQLTLADGALHLTVDVGGLDVADPAAIRVFLLAAKALPQRGGGPGACLSRRETRACAR